MNCINCLTVLVVFLIEYGDTGGHGEKHHDHLRLHMPEFIHHDHHTKVITIHHHHHKPKKEHHHHHHHHHLPKPIVPYGHHYHKHHKKLKTTIKTVSKGKQKHHGLHGHHGHHSHHGHHGHHGHHDPTPHFESPTVNYAPPSYNYNPPSYNYNPPPQNSYVPPSTTFEEDFGSYAPAAPVYTGNISPQQPRLHGVSHTVKQVKVFDSIPGAIPGAAANPSGSPGYQVTEDEEDDDSFTSVNSLHQDYPSTFGYVRGAPSHDPFADPTPQVSGVAGLSAVQTHDPFAGSPQPTSFSSADAFTGSAQTVPFSSSAPDQSLGFPSAQPSADVPVTFQVDGYGDSPTPTAFVGATGSAFAVADHESDDTPVSFSREAGIQQTFKTGGVQTLVY